MSGFWQQKIRRAFSNAAMQYEVLSGLQQEIGRELVQKIPVECDCRRMLDIGMGTGRLTNRLAFFFPDAQVIGMDFAAGMVEYARQKYPSRLWLQADAQHIPLKQAQVDVVVSNLVYQWIPDLTAAFREMFRILAPGGAVWLTLFGRETFAELFEALKVPLRANSDKDENLGRRLPAVHDVSRTAHAAGFQQVSVSTEIVKAHFSDMWSLLKWVKQTGAHAGPPGVVLGRRHLREAADYYEEKFSDHLGIVSTFEVIWLSMNKTVGSARNASRLQHQLVL